MRISFPGSRSVAHLLALCLCANSAPAAIRSLSVTDFRARGDALSISANTVSGSSVVTVPGSNALAGADLGKLMLLFGAGPATTPTNHQDLIARILQVEHGTNITLSAPAGATSNAVYCTYGTQNAEAFQRCVDGAMGTNTIISIPAGNYLLVPPAQLTGFAMIGGGWPVAAAVVLRKGGIQFQGSGMSRTILTGCGAWKLQGKYAHRGRMFVCQGPVSNNYPLIFEDLTMDGGVSVGNTSWHDFPASPKNGSGWDESHDAVVDSGRGPLHRVKEFRNCRFTHWRGEILESVASGWDGFILVSNCVFADANASAFNMSFTHRINSCLFSNLYMAMEFYEGYCSNACFFENSTVTQIAGNTAIAINGALTNRAPPAYTIQGNRFYYPCFAILTTPAQNLSVLNNQFFCPNPHAALGLGCAGYQGSAINRNIILAGNHFIGSNYAMAIMGSGRNRTADVAVSGNTATGDQFFASGYGWSTNVSFRGNRGNAGLWSSQLQGQWFLDDASNDFLPWTVSASTGMTNPVTYAHGMRQRLVSVGPGAIFALDDAYPGRIPEGAKLQISFTGNSPARLYLSMTRPETGSVLLSSGNSAIVCAWTNGSWLAASGQ